VQREDSFGKHYRRCHATSRSRSEEGHMLTRIDDMEGDCVEETQRLRELAVKAWNYITAFNWCPPITGAYLADGVGGIVALFLFEFERSIGALGDRCWVVVGDLPSAYLVVDIDNPKEAFEAYCGLMDEWINAGTASHDIRTVFPVDAPETPENAESLRSRVAFLRREIIPSSSTRSIDEREDLQREPCARSNSVRSAIWPWRR
jgi:hypothetical protein